MRGRKPKPTRLKLMEGNPGKRRINEQEPQPPEGVPSCPKFLNSDAKEEWDRITGILQEMQLLTHADRAALAAYCVAYGRWVEAEKQVQKYGTIVKSPNKGFPMKSPYLTVAEQSMEAMRKMMVEFGLTPSSRSRIKVSDQGGHDAFEAFLQSGRN